MREDRTPRFASCSSPPSGGEEKEKREKEGSGPGGPRSAERNNRCPIRSNPLRHQSQRRLARNRPQPARRRPPGPARLPAAVAAAVVARLGGRDGARRGRAGRLHRAGLAGVGRRRQRRGRPGAHHRDVARAPDPVAGAGRRAVERQDAGARGAAPPARRHREDDGAGQARPRRDRSRHRTARAARGGKQAAGRRAAVARRARRLAGGAGLQRPRRAAPAERAFRHLVAAPYRARSGQPGHQHHRLPRSRASRRGAVGQRRRPRRPLPLCLAAAGAVPLLPRAAALPRKRRGGCPAAHRPHRRRSRPAAGGGARRTGAPPPRRPSRPPARRSAALRRRRGGLARQGPRHRGAAGVGAGAARLGGECIGHRAAAARRHGRAAVGGMPTVGLFPRPRPRGADARLPVGRRAPDAQGTGLDPHLRRSADQPRGRTPRRARPGAERAPVVAGDRVARARRLPAQGRGSSPTAPAGPRCAGRSIPS